MPSKGSRGALPQTEGPLAALLALLSRLRHGHRAFLLRRLSWLMAVAALVAPAVALGCVRFLGSPYLGAQWVGASVLMALAAGFTFASSVVYARLSPRPLATFADIAPQTARLQKLAPSLGSSVASAMALGSRSADGAQGSLVEAHLSATWRAAIGAKPEALLLHLQHGRLRPWRRACARLLVMLLMAFAMDPAHRGQLMQVLSGHTPTVLHSEPLWADVEVQVQPPAYSHLPTTPWAPVGTEVRALCNSVVTLRGRAEARFARGQWMLNGGQPRLWQPDSAGTWQLQFVLQQDTTVEAIFIDSRGMGLLDPTKRHVMAQKDAAPTAKITAPLTEVVLQDHEHFVLDWQAEDDIKLGPVRLRITELGAGASTAQPSDIHRWLPLATGELQSRAPDATALCPGERRGGSSTLNARALGLLPGPGVLLEVVAEDTAPHQHTGASAPLRITLFSQRAHHEGLLDKQQQALDMLVDTLALDIDMKLGPSATRTQSPLTALLAQAVTTQHTLSALATAMQQDALSQDAERLAIGHIAEHATGALQQLQRHEPSLKALPYGAQSAAWQPAVSPHAKRMHTLESDILYLDTLLAQARLDVMQDHVKELLAAKSELQDLIARYRQTGDEALRAQMAQRMAALKDQVHSLMAQMAELRPSLAEGFRNQEAQAQDPWDQTMQRLDQAMATNDVDAMAQDLEHMANMVDNAAQELQSREDEHSQQQGEPLQHQLQELAKTLQELEKKQAELTAEGAQLAHKALQAAAEKSSHKEHIEQDAQGERTLQQALQRIMDHVARGKVAGLTAMPHLEQHPGAYQALNHSVEGLDDVLILLKQQALPEAQDRLHHSAQLIAPIHVYSGPAAAPVHQAQSALARAETELRRLLQRAGEPVQGPLHQQARILQGKQQQLQKQAEAAQQQAQALAQEGPVMGNEAEGQLAAAHNAMTQAAKALGEGQLQQTQQQQQSATDALRALHEAINQSSEGQPGQGKGKRQGMPRPMGQPRPKPRQGSGSASAGTDTEQEVAIPKDEGQKQNSWRQQLLDYAKQAPPQHYEEPVRRYYDELMR